MDEVGEGGKRGGGQDGVFAKESITAFLIFIRAGNQIRRCVCVRAHVSACVKEMGVFVRER